MNEKESIIKYAAKVLQEEADAVQNLKQYLTDDFVKSVETILHSKGRVIVTGIGKSAIIGQKIVSTLNFSAKTANGSRNNSNTAFFMSITNPS